MISWHIFCLKNRSIFYKMIAQFCSISLFNDFQSSSWFWDFDALLFPQLYSKCPLLGWGLNSEVANCSSLLCFHRLERTSPSLPCGLERCPAWKLGAAQAKVANAGWRIVHEFICTFLHWQFCEPGLDGHSQQQTSFPKPVSCLSQI